MRSFATPLALAVLLVACAAPPPAPSEMATEHAASASPQASPSLASVAADPAATATELLGCDGPVSDVGGSGEDVASSGPGGRTAEEAVRAFVGSTVFTIPRDGYEPIGTSGDRQAFAYTSNGRVKVVVVVSTRFGDAREPFRAEELRTCPAGEFGMEVDLGPTTRVWANADTSEILTDIAGLAHCGWESVRMLHVLSPDGSLKAQYVRDPLGVLRQPGIGLRAAYAKGVDLPGDAADSGYRTAEGDALWFAADANAVYVVTATGGVERWPRADPPLGCT